MILGLEQFYQQLRECAETGDWSCFPPGSWRAKDLGDDALHNENPLHVAAVCRKLRFVPIGLPSEHGRLKPGSSGLSALVILLADVLPGSGRLDDPGLENFRRTGSQGRWRRTFAVPIA